MAVGPDALTDGPNKVCLGPVWNAGERIRRQVRGWWRVRRPRDPPARQAEAVTAVAPGEIGEVPAVLGVGAGRHDGRIGDAWSLFGDEHGELAEDEKRAAQWAQARTRHLTIYRRQLLQVGNQIREVVLVHVDERLTGHDEQRAAIAVHAMANAAHPVGVAERGAEAASPARQVRRRQRADRSRGPEHLPSQVRTMTQRAASERRRDVSPVGCGGRLGGGRLRKHDGNRMHPLQPIRAHHVHDGGAGSGHAPDDQKSHTAPLQQSSHATSRTG